MQQEHPFAEYIRILGKGRNGSRGLTESEAYTAMKMIINDEVEPLQLGAFLMLMRVKEETGAEVAAAVKAVKETLEIPENSIKVDLDWSSYAGKKRVLPWYILSTLLMADNGIRIFMHGASGHTAGRMYTKNVLPELGVSIATSMAQAVEQLESHNFAYLDLEQLSPKMHEIIEMRPLLGLRSPVHTIARMLNPFNAEYVMQGIFHPGYQPTHQEAGIILGIPHMAVIKGEGGEIERNPDLKLTIQSVHNGEMIDEEWPPIFSQRHIRTNNADLNILDLKRVWSGECRDEYAEETVKGTIAITLFMMGRAASREEAEQQAKEMWDGRNKKRFH
ncbi:MAG TPA: glycosyl transferase family protein [Ectothiorhodospiraceae bacterium]|nr:glycosyl transferase family protein [Ectothiorhodospiraceae bacterium]